MTFIPEMANMNHAEVESACIPPLNCHEIHQQLLDALGVGWAHTESSIPRTLRLRKMVPPRLALMRTAIALGNRWTARYTSSSSTPSGCKCWFSYKDGRTTLLILSSGGGLVHSHIFLTRANYEYISPGFFFSSSFGSPNITNDTDAHCTVSWHWACGQLDLWAQDNMKNNHWYESNK